MKKIASIHSDFSSKFGIPRQSGLAASLRAQIVFEPEYRHPDAVRGLEEFSHIWLIWEFSETVRDSWSPTVRPPRLGGNTRMGVFATRSPYRPNPIGLSCVRLEEIRRQDQWGPVLYVSGADLMDGTPLYDIKPYLPSADCHPDASGGFTERVPRPLLAVEIPERWHALFSDGRLQALREVLALDPRPPYQHDPDRVYGFPFAGCEVRFTVREGVLTVCGVEPLKREGGFPPHKNIG